MEANSVSKLLFLFCCLSLYLGSELIQCSVTYDRKAIVINGQRRILISGSIHYPRSTPEVQQILTIPLISFLVSHFSFLLSRKCFCFTGWLKCAQMWEDLIIKAKEGGLDVIETYVFWNVHEPSPGNVLYFLPLLSLHNDTLFSPCFPFSINFCFSYASSIILRGDTIW